MSKYNNVNPGHYKTAGREPQGQDAAHEVQRQEFAEIKMKEKRRKPRPAAQAPAKPPAGKQ